MKKTPAQEPAQGIVLPKLNLQHVEITLIGDSPLICHAWSAKAKRAMLDKQMKRARQAKEAKDPEQDVRDSLYAHPAGGFGFPAIAFKAAAVDAASFADGVTKVLLRGAFHINSELVAIEGEPSPREDMVRIGMGTADLRYRAQFERWSTSFVVSFNAGVLSAEQILAMFELAGFHIGVGEWRPQRDGTFGRFHVAREGEV